MKHFAKICKKHRSFIKILLTGSVSPTVSQSLFYINIYIITVSYSIFTMILEYLTCDMICVVLTYILLEHFALHKVYVVNKVHFYAKLTLFKQSSLIYNNINFIIFLTLFKQSLLFMSKVNFD